MSHTCFVPVPNEAGLHEISGVKLQRVLSKCAGSSIFPGLTSVSEIIDGNGSSAPTRSGVERRIAHNTSWRAGAPGGQGTLVVEGVKLPIGLEQGVLASPSITDPVIREQ